jgi:plastocyanin
MNRRLNLAHRRGAAMLLATAALLALSIQAARMPAAASGSRATTSAMSGMGMGMVMQAPAAKKSRPVSMLHKRQVRLTIENYAFSPAQVIVSPGTRVIWTNKDGDPHTVHSITNIWSSGALDTDATFARTFKKSGSFAYYCAIHPFMHGTIIVKK